MLLIGPSGSGKTRSVLVGLEEAVRQGRAAEVKLIVPTASMAEHLLHTLARRGLAVPGTLVQTMREFVAGLTPDLHEPSAALESLLLKQAIASAKRQEFLDLANAPGLHAELLSAMREFWAAGCGAEAAKPLCTTPCQAAFAEVFLEFERLLREKGYAHREERFRRAAEELGRRGLDGVRAIYIDGFVNFTASERRIVEAVSNTVKKLVVTFPAAPATALSHSFPEMPRKHLEKIYRLRVSPAVVRCATPEQEVQEIARRIIADGRPFHEYGVILRAPEAYAPLVQIVFERLRIPFRVRWPKLLLNHGAVRYLLRLCHAVAHDFRAEETLEVFNSSWSPIGLYPETERFDFCLRERLPGAGMDFLQRHARGFRRVQRHLERLSDLQVWSKETCSPRQWAERCDSVRVNLLQLPATEDRVSMRRALELRTLARALSDLEVATSEAAELLEIEGAGEIGFNTYLDALESVLGSAFLRTPDQRRNVVHVLTVFEARQWELPVVFVCGLVEGQFPRHHAQHLLFSDRDRRAFRDKAVHLRTTDELRAEERFLFEVALSRSTEKLLLTYPEFDDDGKPQPRSSFLETPKDRHTPAQAARIREQPPHFCEQRSGNLASPELLDSVVLRHEHFSPTSLESYLQCPYQFFAGRTLSLQGRPVSPEQRIDPLLMGNIAHQTIARWSQEPSKSIAEVFEQIFDEVCEENSIQSNFRTALVRANLRVDLERFATQEAARRFTQSKEKQSETKIEYILDETVQPPFKISGRIDRYEILENELSIVVDYKYSKPEQVKRFFDGHMEGCRVQGPLYLLGLERARGVRPGGVLFWGLRGEVSLYGWALADLLPRSIFDTYKRSVKRLNETAMRGILRECEERTIETINKIRSGCIAVDPNDRDVCRSYCEFRDVCRIKL